MSLLRNPMLPTLLLCFVGLAQAACPYMDGSPDLKARFDLPGAEIRGRDSGATDSFLEQFTLDDSDAYLTSDAGSPIQDSTSLKAGERGPTLLEDFIFRQKITHFDHERVSLPFDFVECPICSR